MLRNYANRIGSSLLANFFSISYSDEAHMLRNQSGKGVFIGNTIESKIPFMFNQDELFNPHVFVAGTTGSGKSYMLKSLIVKLLAMSETSIIILDNTGEYHNIQKDLGFEDETPSKEGIESALLSGKGRQLIYYNISQLATEKERIDEESLLLSYILEAMRLRAIGSSKRVLLILDEAWKLFSSSSILHALLREGRKYNVGCVLASQLIEDIDQSILANIASIFIFRMQDKQSLSRIAKNYLLSPAKTEAVQGLKLGSCLVVQLYKDKTITSFFVDRVYGVDSAKMLRLNCGDNMLEVSEQELEKMVDAIGVKEVIAKIKECIEAGNAIELHELIRILSEAGAGNHQILLGLRQIGIGDDLIADAFSTAVVKNEGK